ncbi:RNA polymerase sigma-70 factor, sigma-E family [Lentzea xinjiangensis]|uniref:RNA polymerase sigma-70 factor, sigma-E family n=1 Tax=Lentzea xinjiangensis TaxID=402600 RepID=A0A1H9BXH2_9PSEU|nr:SigE family RNA polymerase sigma factor [Lentzea xinjiangensis]SEP93579.1 RNA polymerase sigma-70 factor, sigma-E family [Lentzea xinjiangensis]
MADTEYTEYVTAALPWLRRTAYLLCGDVHSADDVVQIAITRLYTNWRRARAAGNLDAYVRAILVRTFLNERRRPWSRERLFGRVDELRAVANPDVETREEVRVALMRVAPGQRAVLVLRFLFDLPVAEVARTLRCSEGTVKSQTSDGLAALRTQMGVAR